MSDFAYLQDGIIQGEGLRCDLEPHIQAVADVLSGAVIDPVVVEMLAEFLVRWGQHWDGAPTLAQLDEAVQWLSLPPLLVQWLTKALEQVHTAEQMQALALHTLDIAERLAVMVYVPELPALFAKGERTGNAARSVGLAQFLRG